MLIADTLTAQTHVVRDVHVHLGTATTIAMWIAVVALAAAAGYLSTLKDRANGRHNLELARLRLEIAVAKQHTKTPAERDAIDKATTG